MSDGDSEYLGTKPGEWKDLNPSAEELFGVCGTDEDDDGPRFEGQVIFKGNYEQL